MAFGRKKKKKEVEKPAKVQKVPMRENPLYPPKKESAVKEVGTALGVAAACLFLSGVIIGNFSYAATGYPSGSDNYQQNNVVEEQNEEVTDGTEEAAEETNEESNEIGKVVENTEPEEAEEVAEPDYIIADSSTRYISTSELTGFTAEQCSRARNEIYARHGRKFQDANLQNYFNSKSWYNGTIEPGAFSESMLNEVEKANAATILSYEKSKGYK